jgi:uncharacterized membrane protein
MGRWTWAGAADNVALREEPIMSQQQPTVAGTRPQTWAIIVWALFIASYFTAAMTGIVAVIIAYVKRGDLAGTPFESHMTSAIRTFWISLIVGIIGVVLAFVGVGFIILGLLALWQLFRVIRGLVRALDGEPIADPTGWL